MTVYITSQPWRRQITRHQAKSEKINQWSAGHGRTGHIVTSAYTNSREHRNTRYRAFDNSVASARFVAILMRTIKVMN